MTVTQIANDFRTTANFAIDDEVVLFRKLARAITNNTQSVFVDETHGPRNCNVSFTLTSGVHTRCEISDLLIISKLRRSPLLRATFWQAKKQKNSKWVLNSPSDKHIEFTGQFNQWDLLSRRPLIRGVPPFDPPDDLLACFDSASIGSFGIFYERASKIEVMHSVAEFIACGSPNAKHPTMVANANLIKYFYNGGEILVRATLEPFLTGLLNHQIGAPLDPANPSHQSLVSYVMTKVTRDRQEIPSDFFGDFPLFIQDLEKSNDGISVVLVNADDRD